ncbi:MAG TPA: hypothetical protein VMH48_11605 [Methylomirabilota bacterium]|nr:hypothetical protein [Methylomirabilota bacterium]
MKKLYLRLFLVVAGLAVCSFPAMAQSVDELVVKVPFSFVAAGRTLPAGEYRVTRMNDSEPWILLFRSRENQANSVLLRVDDEESPSGKTLVNFVAVGDQHFLSRIQTLDHTYKFEVPRTDTLLAGVPQKGTPASETPGNN